MSPKAVNEVVQRALSDESFRSLITDRPYDALEQYELEPDEQGALIGASQTDLAGLGVDPDLARRFASIFHIDEGGGG